MLSNSIRYMHESNEFLPKISSDDWIDLKVTDGKNDAITNIHITIVRNDNSIPTLKSTYYMKVKELNKKQITSNEMSIIDNDTPVEQLKFIVTHPPQYGTLEKLVGATETSLSDKISKRIEDKLISINTNLNQKLNFIFKFGNLTNQKTSKDKKEQFMTVTEFTMSDVLAGSIFYNHRSPGVKQDRFGFIVYDGQNNVFIIDGGIKVSNFQIFNIDIDTEKNQTPVLEKNLGFEYLYQIDGYPGRLIMKNELFLRDKDDSDSDLVFEVARSPLHGHLENKDNIGVQVVRFTQSDVNQNKIYYILKDLNESVFEDSFEFNAHDSANNALRNNRFDIKWSLVSFEEKELSVMESDGKVRVHIKKEGNLKHFGVVACKTVSDTAKSNRDAKLYDFMHGNFKIEFDSDESYKACDIMIHKDQLAEPIESFYVVLEDSKYSIIGSRNKIKVNILDKVKETFIEFERTRFEVHESDKFISLPIVRSGDIENDAFVECLTFEETALNNLDFVARKKSEMSSLVKIPAGEVYGFCDVELIDDDLHETETEAFNVVLVSPSAELKLGAKTEAKILIIGPNDSRSRLLFLFFDKLAYFFMI